MKKNEVLTIFCIAGNFLIRWRILKLKIFVFNLQILKNCVSPFRSFAGIFHWKVPIRWNRVASPNYKKITFNTKSADICLQNVQNIFRKNSLSWQQMSGDFSLQENCLKTIFYTLNTDLPYGTVKNVNVTVKNFSPYFSIKSTVKWTKRRNLYFLIISLKTKILQFKILQRTIRKLFSGIVKTPFYFISLSL
jgi:hypothetical protein